MKKLLLFTVLVLSVLAGVSTAEFNTASLFRLNSALRPILKPYGDKVGICFIDLETGRELQINGNKAFPAASVAKVPVMTAAYHLAEQGRLDLNKLVVFEESDKLEGSGVLRWMKADRQYTLKNLIRLMIVLSDNTATKLVVEEVGYDNVNNYLAEQGLHKTEVVDKTMLNEPTSEAVNRTTPANMARLVGMIEKGGYFAKESSEKMLAYMHNQRYRWGIWQGVPRGVKIANKTGNLDGVLNDVGIVYSPAGNYILSVFTCGLEKEAEARELINKISKAVYETYTYEPAPANTVSQNQ